MGIAGFPDGSYLERRVSPSLNPTRADAPRPDGYRLEWETATVGTQVQDYFRSWSAT
jgi:hypothetical protein